MLRGALVCAGLVAIVVGCGYRPVLGPTARGPDAETVDIRLFENRSREAGVEALLAAALSDEFARRGTFAPREGGGAGSQLILRGAILQVRVTPVAYSSVGLALEERLEVVLQVEVVRGAEMAPVWAAPHLELRARFLASSDNEVYENNKEEAFRALASGAASRIHDELFESL